MRRPVIVYRAIASFLLAATLISSTAWAAAPENRTFIYRGHLDQDGVPVMGTVDLKFRFYPTATGGSAINSYEYGVSGVAVANGEFSAEVLLDPVVLASDPVYMEVQVGSAVLGRQRLAPVPYAMSGRSDGNFVVDRKVHIGINADTSGKPAIAFQTNTGDQADAGKIVYRPSWDTGALSIVGAGTTNTNRRIKLHDHVDVAGNATINGTATAGSVSVTGDATVTGTATINGVLDIGLSRHVCVSPAAVDCDCPAGKQLLGGGTYCAGDAWHINESWPVSTTRWHGLCELSSGQNVETQVMILCARVK